ncbi:PIG-L family deacetylase [Acidiferrimicrobium sp. IK]|uniref:PIG-L deacetylase family protein n=1 Tax=Acidiferrimicrobium sp. IK TaxID=2871700 RepID=UPI0021CB8807|nr:PIG-L deacetylase family protein [Acidiferrimicrobium sp. IK]MCU4185517.1 PIG-L family deacetylase [Acidiferrimicrobium sp. IK]
MAVCAHPDDESFGLGALIAELVEGGSRVGLVTFTHGEASTLGDLTPEEVGPERVGELSAATKVLGIEAASLLDYPDGRLAEVPVEELADHVVRVAEPLGADCLVTFDRGGITGHPDHCRATDAALAAAERLQIPALGWTLPAAVSCRLRAEGAGGFVGRPAAEIDVTVTVDRRRQLAAIACHASQSTANPVLWRRLELQGSQEACRWLR